MGCLPSHGRVNCARCIGDGARVTFVHVEHFASQAALIPNWLGENSHDRAKLIVMAREAVRMALGG